jgi:macrolide transport system ATP-binding/permease protein
MKAVRAWWRRVAGVFAGRRAEQELSAELESHVALHVDDNLRAGMTPIEARRQAMVALGGVESTKEAYRERRGLPAYAA